MLTNGIKRIMDGEPTSKRQRLNGGGEGRMASTPDSSDVLFRTSHSEIAIQQVETLESIITPGAAPIVCNGKALNLAAVAAVAR